MGRADANYQDRYRTLQPAGLTITVGGLLVRVRTMAPLIDRDHQGGRV